MKILLLSVSLLLLLLFSKSAEAILRDHPNRGYIKKARANTPTSANCTERWETQHLDHFGWRTDTWQHRWYVYDKWWKPGGPIFFETGNELSITPLIEANGAMWERGQQFGALLVFAEHRFYGKSMPCGDGTPQSAIAICGDYLSTVQALADYSTLLYRIKNEYYPGASAVIAFGGSYGGELSAMIRMRYPQLIDGAIASSAPLGFLNSTYGNPAGMNYYEKSPNYWDVVTATAETSVPGCAASVKKAIATATSMIQEGPSSSSAQLASRILGLCSVPTNMQMLGWWFQSFFDSMAMGNYPFPSDFIAGDSDHPAPANPATVMCSNMVPQASQTLDLIQQLRGAIDVLGNLTQNVPCYDVSNFGKSVFGYRWDFMVCSSFQPNEIPYHNPTASSMFTPQNYTKADVLQHCASTFGVTPRFNHFTHNGLTQEGLVTASNIVLYNGGFDPWHSGGFLYNISSNPSVVAYWCPDGAHHLDLFFATPQDPPSVQWIRQRQTEHIQKWINEYKSKKNNKKGDEDEKTMVMEGNMKKH